MDNMTAKVSCFARAYHHKNNSVHIFDEGAVFEYGNCNAAATVWIQVGGTFEF